MIEKNIPCIKLHTYDSIDSTSSQLKRMIESCESIDDYTVVTASHQSGGRGQGTNRWSSNASENLTFSFLLRPMIEACQHFYLNMCISLGIKKALDRYIDGVKIKWPNDIYVNNCKLCGILIESTIMGGKISRSIIGVGINVEQKEWEDWVPNPTSMALCGARAVDKDTLLKEVLESIQHYISLLHDGEQSKISATYHDVMYRKDIAALYSDIEGTFEGVICGVDDDGRLMIKRVESGVISRYMFKEVKYL
ncbi:MAG: biotin--[Flavobacteriales bacterium]|nr:biotin--[acetyl-CoA-carboxylase] ligase [Flavobacteriales bacterium]